MPFIVDTIPDVQLQFNGQCFPLYYYEKNDRDALSLFDNGKDEFVRRDAITDFILQRAREEYGPRTTKEDVFYYVYGILHAKEYRKRFAADLQKSLPRLPLVEDVKTFRAFVSAGKKLASLHLNYESIEPHPSVIIENDSDAPTVQQMRFGKSNGEEDKSIIQFNLNSAVQRRKHHAEARRRGGSMDFLMESGFMHWMSERMSFTNWVKANFS